MLTGKPPPQTKKAPVWCFFVCGGGDENRTRVRKWIQKAFFERSNQFELSPQAASGYRISPTLFREFPRWRHRPLSMGSQLFDALPAPSAAGWSNGYLFTKQRLIDCCWQLNVIQVLLWPWSTARLPIQSYPRRNHCAPILAPCSEYLEVYHC